MGKDNLRAGLHTFYALALTQALSLIGSRISTLAISIWIYRQTGNVTPLGLVSFFQILPYVLGANVGGVLADRYNRRLLMAIFDFGQALCTLALLASFASGGFQLWHLYGVTFLQSLFTTIQSPAYNASITMLVPDSHRDRANVITQLAGPFAGIIAAPLAGFIYAIWGVVGAIFIDMLTFLFAVGVLLAIHIPQPQQTAEGAAARGSFLRELFSGLGYLWVKRPLLYSLLLIAMVNFLVSSLGVILTPYLLSRTGSETTLGILLSVGNLGALVGGVLFSIWGRRLPRVPIFLGGVIIACAFIALNGIARHPLALALCMFAYMMPFPMVNATILSIFQVKVAPDMQGRVFAVLGQISVLMTPIAYLSIGVIADSIEPLVNSPSWGVFAPLWGDTPGSGMGLMMSLSAFTAAVGTALAYAVPSIRHLERNLPNYSATPAETAPEAPPSEALEVATGG